jgi:aspartokinase/homoserine dehydrogenase 1
MSLATDSKRATRVLKFGGSSVESVARIRAAAAIIAGRAATHDVVVVVSAMGGATDDLVRAAERARAGSAEANDILGAFAHRHRDAAAILAPAGGDERVAERIERWILDLEHLLHGVSLVRECTPRTLDAILSYGELCSSLPTSTRGL